MLRDEFKAVQKASARDLRKFGLLIGGIACALGSWWWFRHKPFFVCALLPGVPLLLFGVIAPRVLKWPYVAWMGLALVLASVVSPLLLSLLFFLVVTPIGILARLGGKDFLRRKLQSDAASYWIRRDTSQPKTKQQHEQQF